jgi:hypothetical protein
MTDPDQTANGRPWRRYGLVFVLLFLAVTALPVAALNTATVSVHTTASEFSDGKLDDATVEGSGANASVVFDPIDAGSPSVAASRNSSQKLRGASGIALADSSHAVVTGTAEDSLTVLNMSSTKPSITGYVNDSAAMSSAYDVVLGSNDDYAYVTGTGSDSLAVVDVSSRSSPSVAGFVNSSSMMDNPHGLAKSGDYVYVPGYASDSVAVVDVSNPSSPSIVNSITDGSALDGAFDIEVVGDYAYVSTLEGDTVTVLDISSPTAPTVVTTLSDAALDGVNALDRHGDRLVATSTQTDALTVIDISTRESPRVVGSVSSGTKLANPDDVRLAHGYAFVAGENRVTSVDISTPSAPSIDGAVTNGSSLGGASGLAVTDNHVHATAGASDAVTTLRFPGDGQAQYISATHNVSSADNGFADLDITGATATVAWQGYDGSSWTTLASKSVTESGNRTIAFDGSGFDQIRTKVTVSGTLGQTASLAAEGVNFQNHDPVLDTENATPQGEESVSGTNMTMSIPVNDSDFGTVQGEQVDVDFYVDGDYEGTKTLTSNGTATMTATNLPSGKHSWHVEVSDKWGGSATASFGTAVGITLSIHDGDNVSQLLDDRAVTVEILATNSNSDFKVTRTTSDGIVRFNGVPHEQLAVRLEADGYQTRRVIIDHPYKRPNRHTIMLNKSKSSTFEQCFELDSKGAGFPPSDSWLTIESYIDGKWRDVTGTYFGSTNLACVGVTDDQEYRLVVSDGTHTRDLGGYTADKSFSDQVIPLSITEIDVGLGSSGKPYTVDASGSVNQTTGEGSINVTFRSNEQSIEDLHLVIYERGNEDDPVFEKTVLGPVEAYSGSVPISANQTDKTYVMEWDAAKNGSTIDGRQYVSVGKTTVDIGLSSSWKRVAGAGLVLFVGAIFGPISAPIGAVVTGGFSAGLWFVGWLDVQVGVIIYAVSIAVAFYVANRAGGR